MIFSQNSLLASSNLQFTDFLSQRWYLCDKEIISSISKPLKETGVHREEASAGKTCLQAGAGSRAFYPPPKLLSRTNSWSLRRKQQVSQDDSSWERPAGRWDARWGRAGTGRRRRPPGEVCGPGRGGDTTKSVLNTGKLPQEGAQSPRAGSSSGRGKATGSPRSQAPEDAEHPPAPPEAWVPHGGHLLPRVCLGRGGKPGWWEGEQASLQGSLGSWHPEACLRTKTRVQGL